MLNLYSNTRKDGIFMNRRANSSYFHEATKFAVLSDSSVHRASLATAILVAAWLPAVTVGREDKLSDGKTG